MDCNVLIIISIAVHVNIYPCFSKTRFQCWKFSILHLQRKLEKNGGASMSAYVDQIAFGIARAYPAQVKTYFVFIFFLLLYFPSVEKEISFPTSPHSVVSSSLFTYSFFFLTFSPVKHTPSLMKHK